MLRATKTDGKVCYLGGRAEPDGSVIIPVTAQLTAVPGDVNCDLNLMRSSGTVATDSFTLCVRPASAAGETPPSSDEFQALHELQEDFATLMEEIRTAYPPQGSDRYLHTDGSNAPTANLSMAGYDVNGLDVSNLEKYDMEASDDKAAPVKYVKRRSTEASDELKELITLEAEARKAGDNRSQEEIGAFQSNLNLLQENVRSVNSDLGDVCIQSAGTETRLEEEITARKKADNQLNTAVNAVETALLQRTAYATSEQAGTVKAAAKDGISISPEGFLKTDPATETEISAKKDNRRPITPRYLDYAVKSSLTANACSMNKTEQKAVRSWIGADTTEGLLLREETEEKNYRAVFLVRNGKPVIEYQEEEGAMS